MLKFRLRYTDVKQNLNKARSFFMYMYIEQWLLLCTCTKVLCISN
jgi:hypothetical protein